VTVNSYERHLQAESVRKPDGLRARFDGAPETDLGAHSDFEGARRGTSNGRICALVAVEENLLVVATAVENADDGHGLL
jgi:hypothetical protein